jgi:hypothetical protein
MIPIYRVSFFKTVTDSTGHPFDAQQGAVEVHAENSEHAIEVARLKFAMQKRVTTWTLRADYEQAELLPGRSRARHACGR